jgi:hypothetical protein
MYTGRNWAIRGYAVAALIGSIAMAVTGVSRGTPITSSSRTGSTQGDAAYDSALRFSTGQIHQRNKGCKWCAWSGRGAARARLASAVTTSPGFFEFATLTTAPASPNAIDAPADVSEILATDIAFVGDRDVTPVRSVGAVISRLETGMKWRANSFSIAGSRVWSKIIKFTSNGINLRVPLN